jgi:rhodanese-related sulfurtransferase
MDGNPLPVSPSELYSRLGTACAPVLVDVRSSIDFSSSNRLIVGAFHRPADDVERWRRDLPTDRPAVIYCVAGQKASQSLVTALRAAGLKGMSERLMALVGLASLAAFFRWKMSNLLLIAAIAVIDGIVFPLLHRGG